MTAARACHTLAEFEDALVTHLKAQFPKVRVEGFPEAPKEFRFTHPAGTILVHYRGGDFGESSDISAVTLRRRLFWDFTVCAKSLRGHRGLAGQGSALGLLDGLRLRLTGYRIPGAVSGFTPEREDFLDREDSAWIYVARYAHLVPLVQRDFSQPAPPLKRITSQTPDGQQIREVP